MHTGVPRVGPAGVDLSRVQLPVPERGKRAFWALAQLHDCPLTPAPCAALSGRGAAGLNQAQAESHAAGSWDSVTCAASQILGRTWAHSVRV